MRRIEYDTSRDLIAVFGEKKIEERFIYVKQKADKFIEEAGYKKEVECNENLLMHVIVDYFTEIADLKGFHHIEHVSSDKMTAHLVSSILRRKPIQILYVKEEKDIFLNERFALSLFMNECFFDGEIPLLDAEHMKKFSKYIELLLHHFKYQECNPQMLELVIASFKMGSMVVKSDVNNI